jgi:spore germination protein
MTLPFFSRLVYCVGMRHAAFGRLVCLSLCVVLIALGSPAIRVAPTKRVGAGIVFWDQARGFDAVVANDDLFTEISPFWYRVEADGQVVPYTTESGATYEDPAILSFLRSRGILIIPTVANTVDGFWDGQLVSRIITDPDLAAANIASLVQLATSNGYDGIDLDYENLAASDRAAFTSFVSHLASALHAEGKVLTVNVYGKTSEPGTWDGAIAQDWAGLGQAADQVRIMAYEYHWSTSWAGPVSPVYWVNDVLAFATTVIPQEKITHGVPFYGYDWIEQSGTALVWYEAGALAAQYSASLNWDATSASPWFGYVSDAGVPHTVWFENSQSLDAKLQLTAAWNVGGVELWRLGGEDPENWSVLRARFGSVESEPGTLSARIAITSPGDGALLQRRQRIRARVRDNVTVARVEFYVDDVWLATDEAEPFVVYWNTRRASPGEHRIRAVVYDTSGNASAAEVTAYVGQ